MTPSLAMECGVVAITVTEPMIASPPDSQWGDDLLFQYERAPLTTEPVNDTTHVFTVPRLLRLAHVDVVMCVSFSWFSLTTTKWSWQTWIGSSSNLTRLAWAKWTQQSTHFSELKTHFSELKTHFNELATHFIELATHFSELTTHFDERWVSNTLQWVINTLQWVSNTRQWVSNTLQWVSNTLHWVSNTLQWVNNTLRWAMS